MLCLRKPRILKENKKEIPSVCSLLPSCCPCLPPRGNSPIFLFPPPHGTGWLHRPKNPHPATAHATKPCIWQPSGIFLLDFSPAALEAAQSTADPDSSRQDLFLQKHFFNAEQALVTTQRSLTLVTKPLVKMSLENQPCCCTTSHAGLAAHSTERGDADLLPICFLELIGPSTSRKDFPFRVEQHEVCSLSKRFLEEVIYRSACGCGGALHPTHTAGIWAEAFLWRR